MRVGINGLGRIGRCLLRGIVENNNFPVDYVQLNSSSDVQTLAHLLTYDSVHGKMNQEINIVSQNEMLIRGIKIVLSQERDMLKHRWDDIDVVMECTGKLKSMNELQQHIASGAKKVILSSPAKDKDVPTFVIGANHNLMTDKDNIVSIGSCTTNCLAPVAKVVNDNFKIEKGFITTIHAYTNDQNILDGSHKDLRRARSANLSMIPTSTGVASAIQIVLPELKGKLDGSCVRVPVPNVSMIDCTFMLSRTVTLEEVESVIVNATKNDFFVNALSYTKEPLVSIDFVHNPYSSIVDMTEVRIVDGNLLRLLSWYDNEWGFSMRMLDMAISMMK